MSSFYVSAFLAAIAPPLQETGRITWWTILLWAIAIVLIVVFWQWWNQLEEESTANDDRTRNLNLAGTTKSEFVQQVEAVAPPPAPEQADPLQTEEAEETEEAPLPDTAGALDVEEETAVAAPPPEPDDLTKIEGVGPKIAGLLNDADILTFAQLSQTESGRLEEILADAGSRYQLADPATWPQQAALAAEGKWEELETLQEELKGGREEA